MILYITASVRRYNCEFVYKVTCICDSNCILLLFLRINMEKGISEGFGILQKVTTG
jgi:hypothetical protein